MQDLVAEIKQKKELASLPDSLIESTIKKESTKYKLSLPLGKKERKAFIKIIRAVLRRYSGQYQMSSSSKKLKFLESNNVDSLLKSHRSSNERIEDYSKLKEVIFSLNPRTILDLGCGLNPLAIAEPRTTYYAYDLNSDDLEIVSKFFADKHIAGEVHHEDITKVKKFPNADLCLMLKLLDILPGNRQINASDLINKINSNHFIISFATKTISGRPMNRPYRRWFEKILNDLKYPYRIERTKNEMFYVISKLKE